MTLRPQGIASKLPPGAQSRRDFVRAISLEAAALAFFGGPAGRAPGTAAAEQGGEAKPFKISLAQWSLHKELEASRLDPLDFPRVANGFGIDAVEYVSSFYAGKVADRGYLSELKRRAAGEGVWNVLIMVDGEGELGAPEEKARRRAVEKHKKWVEAAAFLGCHAIRVNAESRGSEDDQVNWLSDGLRRLARFSDPFGISVLLENHQGLSARASWLVEVLNAVGHPRCGSLPDFGNFALGDGQHYDRYKGVRELMPFARAVSAKSYDFDARGDETGINYLQMLEIVTGAGYHGYVGIEYEGTRLSERAGILRTKQLLERVREQLAARTPKR